MHLSFGEATQPAGFAEGSTSPTPPRPGSRDLLFQYTAVKHKMHTMFHESCWPLGSTCLTPDCWTAFPSRGLVPAALSSGLRALASMATLWFCACCRAVVQWNGAVADPARDQGGARHNEEDIPVGGCPYVHLEHCPAGQALSEAYTF